jgi:hypothetical protein
LHHQLNCIQLYINALRPPSIQALQTDLQEQKVREEGQIEHPSASPTANWLAAADAGGWPVGGGLRTTLARAET